MLVKLLPLPLKDAAVTIPVVLTLTLPEIVPDDMLEAFMLVKLLPLPLKDDAVMIPEDFKFPSLVIERPLEVFGFPPT